MKYESDIYTIYAKYLLPENENDHELDFQISFNIDIKAITFEKYKKKCYIYTGK